MEYNAVVGVFYDADEAQGAISDLEIRGYDTRDMSIIMRDKERASKFSTSASSSVTGGAVSGAATGAIIGGLSGLLGAFIIPGLGAFLIGGPVAAALGLTGAAASTVSGVATGALAGGLIGALTGLGLSRDEVALYEKRVKEGGVLLIVPSFANDEEEVRRILINHGADNVRVTGKSVVQNNEIIDTDGNYVNPVQVERYLKDVNYPASKDRLIQAAKQEGADSRVIFTLQSLRGQIFHGPGNVSRAVGELGQKGGEAKKKQKKMKL